jgi:hypothetical protein
MKINKIFYIWCVFTIISVSLLAVPTSTEASISPPRIKIEAKPRDKISFNLEVKNRNDSPRSYKTSYSYYIQDIDGFQKEIKLDDKSVKGPWDWITLDSGETFNVDGKKSLPIKGTVNIPSRNSHGFHNILITVTEITPVKKTGVTLNYASGSLIELTVTGSKKRPKTAILNPIIKIDEESGMSMVHLDFDNQSPHKGRLYMEMHLRHNKRLISKTPLLTHQSHKSEMTFSSVFPDNLVHVSGKIEKKLDPGDYEIRIVGKFNGVRLRSFNQKVSINDSGQSTTEEKTNKTVSDSLKKAPNNG